MSKATRKFIVKISSRFKVSSESKQFFLMFILTYAVTILLAVIIVFNHFDDEVEKYLFAAENAQETLSSWQDIFRILKGRLQFNGCGSLNPDTYIIARIAETLVPTTITFSGTILVLQVTANPKHGLNTVLFCLIVLLALAGMSSIEVHNAVILDLYITMVIVSSILCVFFSYIIYVYQTPKKIVVSRRQELSDGIMNRRLR